MRGPFRRLLRAATWVALPGTIVSLVLAVWIAWPLPADMAHPAVVPSLALHDRHGLALRTTRAQDGSRGGWIAFDRIDPEIIQAFIAAEDRRFFVHRGVDVMAIARAARDNIHSRRIVSGASTLTMQTARLLRPASRDWFGKMRQALWALRLEVQLEKNRILEAYLNRVPLGQGTVGVAAASQLYFGASASDVSLGQAAMLAGLAHLPSRENPMVQPESARIRRNHVLATMSRLGFASPADMERAAREPVLPNESATRFAAPHFTTQLLLRTPPGTTGTLRTTIDLELQRAIEAEVRHTINNLKESAAKHAAAVVLDNRSGEILAWVGSPDFFADSAGQVDMVVSPRQPGSTLKPFLYGLAFDRGFTAASVLPDVPRTWTTTTGPYRPQNYDRRFRGPVRIREALASSYNVPAVELTSRVGASALLNTLRDAGFASLSRSPDHYGLGLALGNGEVTLLELANAYRGLANGGVSTPVRWLQEDAPGSSILRAANTRTGQPDSRNPRDPGTRFMSAGAAVLVLDILRDPVARIPGFGEATPLDLPFPVAAKTGTSRHFTDNWAVASAGNFTIAVWVGNFSGRPMQGVSGITGAGPLLYRSALQVGQRYAPGYLPTPEQVQAETASVCALSGQLATPECPSLVEWFLPGTVPDGTDNWQRNGRTTLPPEYADWLAMSGEAAELAAPVPSGSASAHNSHAAPATTQPSRILSPRDGDVYEIPAGMDARFATLPLSAAPNEGTIWKVDGEPVSGSRWRLRSGSHTVIACYTGGHADTVRITVR
jgi:penicillin-binding protein 1C